MQLLTKWLSFQTGGFSAESVVAVLESVGHAGPGAPQQACRNRLPGHRRLGPLLQPESVNTDSAEKAYFPRNGTLIYSYLRSGCALKEGVFQPNNTKAHGRSMSERSQ